MDNMDVDTTKRAALALKCTCALSAIVVLTGPITTYDGRAGGSLTGPGITGCISRRGGYEVPPSCYKLLAALAFGVFALLTSGGILASNFKNPCNHALLAKASVGNGLFFMLVFSLEANALLPLGGASWGAGFVFAVIGWLASIAHCIVSTKAAKLEPFIAPRAAGLHGAGAVAHVNLNGAGGGAVVGLAVGAAPIVGGGNDEVGCTACGGDQKSYASGSYQGWAGCSAFFLVTSIIVGAVLLPKECCTTTGYWCGGVMPCNQVFGIVAAPPIAMIVSLLALCKCCCFGVPRRPAMAMQQFGSPGAGAGAPPVQLGVAAPTNVAAAPKFDPNTGQPIAAAPKFDPNTGQPIAAPCSSCGSPSTGAPFCASCGAKA